MGLGALITENIMDDRRGKDTQLPLPVFEVKKEMQIKMAEMRQGCPPADQLGRDMQEPDS
jgi:hypothetical protein